VEHLVLLNAANGKKLIAVAGGNTRWITALDGQGARRWATYAPAAVSALTASDSGDRLCVGCDDGSVQELDNAGRLLRSISIGEKHRCMLSSPSDVVLGTEEGGVYRLR
jgi:hypothetical protein